MTNRKKHRTVIGIDTGVHTGVAIKVDGEYTDILTLPLHKALFLVLHRFTESEGNCMVYFEDARLRKWIPDSGDIRREMGRRQGAGSVKRDAVIWEEFLTDYGIPFQPMKPAKGATKPSEEQFRIYTGWKKRTSNHARDAAFLILGRD